MLTQEEVQYLTQFVFSRSLNGLNLYDAKKVLDILAKIQQEIKEKNPSEKGE